MKRLAMVIGLLAFGAASAVAQRDTASTASSASYSAGGEEGWLGMGISCSHCTMQGVMSDFGRASEVRWGPYPRRWTFRELPVVFSVETDGPADRAGLRTGDTLVSTDGFALTSREGGQRFANIRPGQAVTLRYRRDGQEADTHVTAGSRPRSVELEMQDSLRAAARAQARQAEAVQRALERQLEQVQRLSEQYQRAIEQQPGYQRALEELRRLEGQTSDSSRLAAMRRVTRILDSASARWRVAESLYAQVPAPVAPVMPVMPWPAAAPVAPAMPYAPLAPVAPLNYSEHRAFGPLRYSGQLADVVIEARSPSAATATEVSDSEVVVTSRDLSVRIAIRPRQPTPRAAPAPKPAPAPRPARTTPKPPQPAHQEI